MLAQAFFEAVHESMFMAIIAGIVAGIAHVFMGPDHLGALLPISVNRRFKAAWLGFRWGAGHTIGVVIVAIMLIVARTLVENAADWTESFEYWGEIAVGAFLVTLGGWGLWQARTQKLHVHTHSHDGSESHAHLHAHTGDEKGWHAHLHKHAALGAGTFHGIAGMAHLLVVAPVVAAPNRLLAFTYLGGYALGSIGAMTMFAGVFGAITAKLGDRGPKLVKGLMIASALACLLIGAAWITLTATGIELFAHDH
ncbi:MAG: nickel transporter [Planctomycetes bacterium]|nr:nickel transporter [Planctomycetota bacterium]MCW8136775.1 nickel transporter [Planctomycetota bacterium]